MAVPTVLVVELGEERGRGIRWDPMLVAPDQVERIGIHDLQGARRQREK